jgi:hypothetical protein
MNALHRYCRLRDGERERERERERDVKETRDEMLCSVLMKASGGVGRYALLYSSSYISVNTSEREGEGRAANERE